jgi:hypothetical protein
MDDGRFLLLIGAKLRAMAAAAGRRKATPAVALARHLRDGQNLEPYSKACRALQRVRLRGKLRLADPRHLPCHAAQETSILSVPPEIIELVERFGRNKAAYTGAHYNETQLRREFLDPFFTPLWISSQALRMAGTKR